MLFSDSAYLSKGVVGFLIPYEDKLMFFLIQQTCQRGGGGFLIPYEHKRM